MSNRDRTNKERAAQAALALAGYDGEGSEETDVTDILADLMHYCEEKGWSFNQAVGNAVHHFYEEQEEEK